MYLIKGCVAGWVNKTKAWKFIILKVRQKFCDQKIAVRKFSQTISPFIFPTEIYSHNQSDVYFNFASAALIASKFGKSFGVGVCSLYCTTPCLSIN